VKVIEKGREQRGWAKECRCTGEGNGGGGCGARLLVDEEDLTAYRQTDMLWDAYGHCVTFKCPECWVETDLLVSRGSVSEVVWKRVWKRQQK